MAKKDIIKELTDIKGIGQAKAEALYDNGFTSIDKIKKAKKEELTKINGITDSIADKIINNYKKATTEKPKEEKPSKPKEKKQTEKQVKKEVKDKPKKETSKKTETKSKTEEKKEEKKKEKKFKPKKKPEISKDLKEELEKRQEIKSRTPKFRREEWYRYKRVKQNWRRPDGIHSKMRINLKYRPARVRVGFRGPKKVRGLHSSGFEEVMVYNKKDLEKIDPKTQAGRIGSSVGTRKRMDIEKEAEKQKIRILNIQHER